MYPRLTYVDASPEAGANITAAICVFEHHPPRLPLHTSTSRSRGRPRASIGVSVVGAGRAANARRVAHGRDPRGVAPVGGAGRRVRLLELAAQLPHQALEIAQPLHDDGGLRVRSAFRALLRW